MEGDRRSERDGVLPSSGAKMIGTLSLPGGSWFIDATVTVGPESFSANSLWQVNCELRTEAGRLDSFGAAGTHTDPNFFEREEHALSGSVTFADYSLVWVQCSDFDSSTPKQAGRWSTIRMVAVQGDLVELVTLA